MISAKNLKAKKRDFCRFSMMLKTVIFVLAQIQKVIVSVRALTVTRQ